MQRVWQVGGCEFVKIKKNVRFIFRIDADACLKASWMYRNVLNEDRI